MVRKEKTAITMDYKTYQRITSHKREKWTYDETLNILCSAYEKYVLRPQMEKMPRKEE